MTTHLGYPSHEEARRAIDPLLFFLYGSLERSIGKAQAYFDLQKDPIDPSLFPSIVRFEWRKEILAHATTEISENGDTLEVLCPYNLGIHLNFAGYHIRAFKSKVGGAPLPGGSDKRIRFFCQEFSDQYVANFEGEVILPAPSTNLCLIWSVDRSFNLVEMRLCLPLGWQDMSLDTFWDVTLDVAEMMRSVNVQWSSLQSDIEDDLVLEIEGDGLSLLDTLLDDDLVHEED
jgi:hypothetical protein